MTDEIPDDISRDPMFPLDPAHPADLGRLYELLLAPARRHRTGTFLTPIDVARHLVACLDSDWKTVGSVLDPSVGGGAFLIAAADRLVASGRDPGEVRRLLHGIDIDADAVGVAELAIGLWGLDHGLEPEPQPTVRVGDALVDELGTAEVIVGNPPFINQLKRQSTAARARRETLRTRHGSLVSAYTDEAWLFLAVAAKALAPGGRLALVQPVSVLAAKHAAGARDALMESCDLRGLWLSDGKVFDAAVEVCAPILERRGPGREPPLTKRWVGHGFDPAAPCVVERPEEWAVAAAELSGVPRVEIQPSPMTIGSIAALTAGFRDQFYGIAPYVADEDRPHRLVTVGMIDPLHLRWGDAAFRFAGEPRHRPTVDVEALAAADPKLGEWIAARLRPKVLLATQTKVLEPWPDPQGLAVPATPVVSLEPHTPDDLWMLAALLLDPAISASLCGRQFGTALSTDAIKVAASTVAEVPLPSNRRAWSQAADAAQAGAIATTVEARREFLIEAGRHMVAARRTDDACLQWWIGRLPDR